jgi:hypothetical protein
MMGNMETFVISYFKNTRQGEVRAVGTSSPRSSYRALSTVNTWHEYFTEISDKQHQLDSFVDPDFSLNETFVQSLPREKTRSQVKNTYSDFLKGKATLSMALTVLAALEDSISDLSTR